MIRECGDRWLDFQSTTKQPKTVESYRGRLKAFLDYLDECECLDLSFLAAELVVGYGLQLKEKQLSINAQYVYLECAKKFLLWLYEKSYSFVDLSGEIVLPKWERKKKAIKNRHDYEQQLKTVTEAEPVKSRNQAILALYLYEGLKTGQMSELTTLDIDLVNKELRLKARKRFHKLDGESCKYMKKYLKQRNAFNPLTDYLFIGKGGRKLDGQSINLVRRRANQWTTS